MAQRMFDPLYYLRWNSSLPLRLNKLAPLIIGRQWRSQGEWYAHAPLAIKAGLAPEIVADLKGQKRPAVMKPDEALVYDFVTELTGQHQVSDATFARAARQGASRRQTAPSCLGEFQALSARLGQSRDNQAPDTRARPCRLPPNRLRRRCRSTPTSSSAR